MFPLKGPSVRFHVNWWEGHFARADVLVCSGVGKNKPDLPGWQQSAKTCGESWCFAPGLRFGPWVLQTRNLKCPQSRPETIHRFNRRNKRSTKPESEWPSLESGHEGRPVNLSVKELFFNGNIFTATSATVRHTEFPFECPAVPTLSKQEGAQGKRTSSAQVSGLDWDTHWPLRGGSAGAACRILEGLENLMPGLRVY